MDDTTRRRGRPPSAAVRDRALAAASRLLDEEGWNGFSIDEVARRSTVSKATIYKHWSGRFPLAAEAYGRSVTEAIPVRSTGRVAEDLIDQVLRLNRFYRSRQGRVIGELLGAGISEPGGPELLRRLFFEPRRAPTRDLLLNARDDGLLLVDLDADLMIDLLFGVVVFRLFNGLPPLDDREVVAGAAAVVSVLVRPQLSRD